MLLAGHFARRIAYELGRSQLPRFTREAISALEGYPWPGNVRELKNVVERAVYRADEGERIGAIVFDPFVSPYPQGAISSPGEQPARQAGAASPELRPLRQAVADLEVALLRQALQTTRFNQRQAAALLDLSYDQFRGLLRKHRSSFDPQAIG